MLVTSDESVTPHKRSGRSNDGGGCLQLGGAGRTGRAWRALKKRNPPRRFGTWAGFLRLWPAAWLEGRRGSDDLHRPRPEIEPLSMLVADREELARHLCYRAVARGARQNSFAREAAPVLTWGAQQRRVRHGCGPGMIHQDWRLSVQLEGWRGSNPVNRMPPPSIARRWQQSSSRIGK